MLPKTNIIVLFGLLFSICCSQSQAEAQNNSLARPMEEVVVYGKRPGPPFWRVDHDNHVLWIFGSLLPLPKSLEWDSISAEYIMSESQEFVRPPTSGVRVVGPIKAYRAWRKLNRLEKNRNGGTLKEVLPPVLYSQFLKAKTLYAPDNTKILKLRPMIAARKLHDEAIETVGLTNASPSFLTLLKIAKKEKMKITETGFTMDIELFWASYENTPLNVEVSCLETTLDSIESDLEGMLIRAHAWAEADTDLLKESEYPDPFDTCAFAGFSSKEGVEMRELSRQNWLDAAETALRQNEVTFATLSIRELIRPEGLLAALKDRLKDQRVVKKSTVDAQ